MKEGRRENSVKRVIEKEIRKSRKEGFRGDSRKKKERGRSKKSFGERKGKNARVNTR